MAKVPDAEILKKAGDDVEGVLIHERDISEAERAKLDKEIEAKSQSSAAFWKRKADAGDWDSVIAPLDVYKLSGQVVTEDPRRQESYREQVIQGLGFGSDVKERKAHLNDAEIEATRDERVALRLVCKCDGALLLAMRIS